MVDCWSSGCSLGLFSLVCSLVFLGGCKLMLFLPSAFLGYIPWFALRAICLGWSLGLLVCVRPCRILLYVGNYEEIKSGIGWGPLVDPTNKYGELEKNLMEHACSGKRHKDWTYCETENNRKRKSRNRKMERSILKRGKNRSGNWSLMKAWLGVDPCQHVYMRWFTKGRCLNFEKGLKRCTKVDWHCLVGRLVDLLAGWSVGVF